MLTQDMKTDIVNGLLSIFREDILQIILYGSDCCAGFLYGCLRRNHK